MFIVGGRLEYIFVFFNNYKFIFSYNNSNIEDCIENNFLFIVIGLFVNVK